MSAPVTHPTPETQFVLELPAEWRPFVNHHFTTVVESLVAALGAIFDVPVGRSCRISLHYTDRLQLVEVNGVCGRESPPLEVQGALRATFAILTTQLSMQSTLFHPRDAVGQA